MQALLYLEPSTICDFVAAGSCVSRRVPLAHSGPPNHCMHAAAADREGKYKYCPPARTPAPAVPPPSLLLYPSSKSINFPLDILPPASTTRFRVQVQTPAPGAGV
eukprot:1164928-Prorocentrum_minimum.AAC.1